MEMDVLDRRQQQLEEETELCWQLLIQILLQKVLVAVVLSSRLQQPAQTRTLSGPESIGSAEI